MSAHIDRRDAAIRTFEKAARQAKGPARKASPKGRCTRGRRCLERSGLTGRARSSGRPSVNLTKTLRFADRPLVVATNFANRKAGDPEDAVGVIVMKSNLPPVGPVRFGEVFFRLNDGDGSVIVRSDSLRRINLGRFRSIRSRQIGLSRSSNRFGSMRSRIMQRAC